MDTKYTTGWRKKLHEIIYEADTKAGKWFDIVLLLLILASIAIVMIESVESYRIKYKQALYYSEWVITIFFTIEYIARIIVIAKPTKYIFSFFGLVDFFSTIPKYLLIFVVDANALLSIRALRLLRVFRVLKLARFVGESENLARSLKASRAKIAVFLLAVMSMVVILGTVMYTLEADQDSGFDSIPRSVYWAIVTLTTVGYGDITPVTALGQFIASFIMIMGYGIIAVPTGIVTSEYTKHQKVDTNTQACQQCTAENHSDEAIYCYHCGEELNQ